MSRFEKGFLWVTTALVTVTGGGLLWTKYFVQSNDPWSVINHPWEPWLLKAHILSAPLLIFAVGLIATRHIWQHFSAGLSRGRRSGILTVLVTAPMVVSGYLIQVLTHSGWLQAMAIAHIGFSGLFLLGFAAHQIATGRRRGRVFTSRAAERRSVGRERGRADERSRVAPRV